MRRFCFVWLSVCVSVFGVYVYAQRNDPPEGVTWEETIQATRITAVKRNLPVLIFCHDTTYEASNKMYAYFKDPLIRKICKRFVCLYLNQAHNRDAYQQAYVPYLASTPRQNIRPPIIVICDKTLWPQRDFRIEGNCPELSRFARHLENALRKLSPEEHLKFLTECVPEAPWSELIKRVEDQHIRLISAVQGSTNIKTASKQALFFFKKLLLKRIKTNLSPSRAKHLLKALSKYIRSLKSLSSVKGKRAKEKAIKSLEDNFSSFFDDFRRQAERMKLYFTCGKRGHPIFTKDPGRCLVCKKPTRPFEFDPDDLWGCGEDDHPKYFGTHPQKCHICKKELQQGK